MKYILVAALVLGGFGAWAQGPGRARGAAQGRAKVDSAHHAASGLSSGVVLPASKPVIAQAGQPLSGSQGASSGAARQGRGFDFWVLLPILLLAGVGMFFWRKYLEVKEELRARKVEMRSFNENYFASGAAQVGRGGGSRGGSGGSGSCGVGGLGADSSGSGGSGMGVERKELERAIANSNVLAELNEAIGKLQLRISQLEGKGGPAVSGGGAAATGGSAAVAPGAGGSGGRDKGKVEKAKADGADVFYMAGPVNNYFPNSAKSLTKDNTVYRFKVSANKQDAEFELHTSGAPINEIVQLAESYIKAACDEENLPSYPVKNIVTRKAGVAVLDGDKWIIKSKALIRYE